ncbi:hypothetical protein [Rheinheimera texasensis]|uniref:hypothetical protein n=1 Tax=Rheinheimera texasensis TaxID=306205 RepID=UPI0004E22518|nr:hypothetical protein [Rheinheimera texasensis]
MQFWKVLSLGALFFANLVLAEVYVNDSSLKLTGTISNDEFSKFKTKFESVLTRNDMGINELHLFQLEDVKGGSLSEAIKIADFVRSMRLRVNLTGECSSACVLIYFASVERKHDHGATLGVHRIRFANNGLKSLSLDDATQSYQAGEKLLVSKLSEYGAPDSIIEQLKGTSSRDLTIIPIGEVPIFPPVVFEWLQDSCDQYPLKYLNIGHHAFNALEQAFSQGTVSKDTPAMTIARMVEQFGQEADPSFTFAGYGQAEGCVSGKLYEEYSAKKKAYCQDNSLSCGSIFKRK